MRKRIIEEIIRTDKEVIFEYTNSQGVRYYKYDIKGIKKLTNKRSIRAVEVVRLFKNMYCN